MLASRMLLSGFGFSTARAEAVGRRRHWHFRVNTLECKERGSRFFQPCEPVLVFHASGTESLPEEHAQAQRRLQAAPSDARTNALIDVLLAGRNADPFALLGPHPMNGTWSVRFFLPWAAEAAHGSGH